MESLESTIHLAPADQPESVHEITGRLFSAYALDGGVMHLAGCMLEDRLFVRVDLRYADRTVQIHLDARGNQVGAAMVGELGMTRTVELPRPPEDAQAEINRLLDLGIRMAKAPFPPDAEPLEVEKAALWCKYASGKLRFTFGESSADLPFADWGRKLVAPPFVCPYSGISTFHLAATDDGRIAAADAMATCEETGARVLASELVTCSVTGRQVVPEAASRCSVCGQHVLSTELVECKMCRQSVSPATISRGRCAACRTLTPVAKDDPRVARLLEEHAPLARWDHWRLSETETVYILTASGWTKRLLVVADKESLRLSTLAEANRFFGGWVAMDSLE